MTEIASPQGSWEVASNAEEVHALLCASDAHHATPENPAPARRLETTRRRVQAGSVHLLRQGAEAIAMFTLTWEPPFEADLAIFPPAGKPAYLSRLVVHPAGLARGSLAGARCLRRAVELATAGGADVLRSEANPDLTQVRALLGMFGFEEHGRAQSEDGRRRVYLQKVLR
ncbi:hypothetical protein [Sorangium sp. So ce363]|uniref:hypothetical protein n=1 Tax=Sorangium sp. So ce363 TaxID=3133304 RepID=UPI003F620756